MLRDLILSGQGPRLYGISPPKAGNTPERNREIAAAQVERINALHADGIVVYDIQDEPGRTGAPRAIFSINWRKVPSHADLSINESFFGE